MFELLRGETLKSFSTRATFLLLGGAVTVVALATASTMLSMPPGSLAGPIHEQVAYFIGLIVVAVFAVIIGMRTFTDEFRHGTIVPTVLVSASRGRLLLAKVAVAVSLVVVLAVAALAALVAAALGLSSVKGGDLTIASSDWTAFAGFLGASVAWTVLGTGVGALVRSQIAGVVAALLWVLVIENFASGFLGDAARYMPGQLAQRMAQANTTANLLGAVPALLIFAGYAFCVCLAAWALFDRRDVI